MMKKRTIIIFMVSLFGVIIFFVVSFLFLFNDEFVTVNIVYRGNDVEISKDPRDFAVNRLSRFTSINAIWHNDTEENCKVIVSSSDGTDEFILNGRQVYGSFLPKDNEIKILFCDIEKNIRM